MVFLRSEPNDRKHRFVADFYAYSSARPNIAGNDSLTGVPEHLFDGLVQARITFSRCDWNGVDSS
jgi:hypothetical protein